MESTMKPHSTAAPAVPALLVDAVDALSFGDVTGIPVARALASLGDPRTPSELAQRLIAAVAMMWPDVAGADLFLPRAGSGELEGVADAAAGGALLASVASPHGQDPHVRIIPVTPS